MSGRKIEFCGCKMFLYVTLYKPRKSVTLVSGVKTPFKTLNVYLSFVFAVLNVLVCETS